MDDISFVHPGSIRDVEATSNFTKQDEVDFSPVVRRRFAFFDGGDRLTLLCLAIPKQECVY